LEGFALAELAELEVWAETAKLSEREQRVYELDKRPDYETADIARELDIAESTVRVQRKNYIAKIRKVAGL
jgi:DNA-directed RNA polymerase specialized sigma subunit